MLYSCEQRKDMLQTLFILVPYSVSMLLLLTECSIVIDKTQDTEMVDICTNETYAEYCKPIGDCKAGTHIMCESWRSAQVMGPYCTNARMMKLRKATKQLILDAFNEIRHDLVSGVQRIKDDAKAPRAYGLHKLAWDRDLATFAQVWANQCRMKNEDTCRATKRFDNPGQMVNVEEFPSPEETKAKKKCLTHERLLEAVKYSLRAWKLYRTYTTIEMFHQYHDIIIDGMPRRNYFLMMAFHKSTHIGCGMSAYDTYQMDIVNERHHSYALQLVCNLSHQAKPGEPSYISVKPAVDSGYSEKCGCPPNTTEDSACLCVDPSSQPTTQASATTTPPTIPPTTTEVTTTPPITTEVTKIPSTTTEVTKTPPLTTEATKTSPASTEATTAPTTELSPHTSDVTVTKHDEDDYDNDNDNGDNANLNRKKPEVLILPIITVADAPPEKYQQQMRSINEKLRDYSRKVFSPKDIIRDIDKSIEKPPTTRKNSIFTNVPTFHLPSENNVDEHKEGPKENVVLKKKLIELLEEVPRKLLYRLEEALQLKQKRKQQNLINTNTVYPLSIPTVRTIQMHNEVILDNTATQKMEDHDGGKFEYDAQNKRTDETYKEIYHGLETSYIQTNKETYPNKQFLTKHSKVIENSIGDTETGIRRTAKTIKNGNGAVDTLPQYAIPVLRKQIPIAHAKVINKHFPDNYESNINMENYRKEQINKAFIDDNKDLTNYKVDDQRQARDDTKLKRRMYLENEIRNLKRKLLHLRQYILQNDMTESDRFRPMVGSHYSNNKRRNVKSNDGENFYMPDRAHSLHDV